MSAGSETASNKALNSKSPNGWAVKILCQIYGMGSTSHEEDVCPSEKERCADLKTRDKVDDWCLGQMAEPKPWIRLGLQQVYTAFGPRFVKTMPAVHSTVNALFCCVLEDDV